MRTARAIDNYFWYGIGIFAFSIIMLYLGFLIRGPVLSVDTQAFVSLGTQVVHLIGSSEITFEEVKRSPVYPHYVVSSVILGSIYLYCKDPIHIAIVLNILLFSIISTMLMWLCYRLWGMAGRLTSIIAGFYIIYGLPDGFLWSYYVLTDVIFLFVVVVFIVMTVMGMLQKCHSCWIVAFIAAMTAPFVRPTGILLPFLFLFALMLVFARSSSRTLTCLEVLSIIGPGLFVLVIVPWLVSSHLQGQNWVYSMLPDVVEAHFNQALHYFKQGWVVANRPSTYVEEPLSYFDIVNIIVRRLIYFFVPLRVGYSNIHNYVNSIYMLLAVPMMVIGLKNMGGRRIDYRKVRLFLVFMAYAYGLLHAITLLSFDWRYQVPAMVPLWILASGGAVITIHWYRLRNIIWLVRNRTP